MGGRARPHTHNGAANPSVPPQTRLISSRPVLPPVNRPHALTVKANELYEGKITLQEAQTRTAAQGRMMHRVARLVESRIIESYHGLG